MTDYIWLYGFKSMYIEYIIVSSTSVQITFESQFFDQYFTFSKQIPFGGLHTYIHKEVNVEG